MVNTMHEVWTVAVENVAGSGNNQVPEDMSDALNQLLDGKAEEVVNWARSPVDEFFYTVMYVIVVYMVGMSCFKLIDQIPNNILRWMGQNVKTFNDSREDAGQSLVGSTYVSGQQAFQGIGTSAQKMTAPTGK